MPTRVWLIHLFMIIDFPKDPSLSATTKHTRLRELTIQLQYRYDRFWRSKSARQGDLRENIFPGKP